MGWEWEETMAPDVPWQTAYEAVRAAVVEWLDANRATRYTTDEIVEALYPERYTRGAGITARKRIYTALRALAKHGLADYCEPGPQRKLKHTGKLVTPLIWRAPPPAEPKLCPHCGGAL